MIKLLDWAKITISDIFNPASSSSLESTWVFLFAVQTRIPVARFLERNIFMVNPFSLKSKATFWITAFRRTTIWFSVKSKHDLSWVSHILEISSFSKIPSIAKSTVECQKLHIQFNSTIMLIGYIFSKDVHFLTCIFSDWYLRHLLVLSRIVVALFDY